jgi:hypothetical protein
MRGHHFQCVIKIFILILLLFPHFCEIHDVLNMDTFVEV